MPIRKSKLKLGEILLRENLLKPEQLNQIVQIQNREGGRLGEIIVKQGLLSEQDIVIAVGKQLGIPYTSLGKESLKPAADQNLDKLIPEDFARRYELIPLFRNMNSLTVAFVDPLDLVVTDNLRRMTSCDINAVIATKADIVRAVDEFYGQRNMLQEAVDDSYSMSELETQTSTATVDEERLSLDEIIARAGEAPVVKLVDLILKQAIEDGASDIHIEPFEDRINIRYRIDGVLYEISPPAKHLLLALVSRIKILAKLDIAEKRLPQDGAFVVKIKDRLIDTRVSTVPVIYGEKIVIRILDKSSVSLDMKMLGMDREVLEKFEASIRRPNGLVFLTGPTGSGKTTTLYAMLNAIRSPEINIVTIEDPVEYRLDGINQVQVNSKVGLTFAAGLRSFLRQDPNVIMVGEVRDLETAQICVRASLTGHLVLSTLHTNDAIGAIIRLVNIGIESFLIASSLIMVGAQRLVRRLCLECREAFEPTPEIRQRSGLKEGVFYRPKGCPACHQTGFRGRVAIYEVVLVTERLQDLITQGVTGNTLRATAIAEGMITLLDTGLKRVREGVTSLEEVMSVTVGKV